MLPTATNLHSIGKQLMAARVERGLTVEDIAFKTHIPANRLKELENDDFSNFANLTYAKGFLKIYSGYLNLDLSEYLNEFNTSDFANISGHDYIQSANTGLTTLSMAVAPKDHSGRGSSIVAIALLIIAAIGLPIWYWHHAAKEDAPELVHEQTAPVNVPKARVIKDTPEPEPPAPVVPQIRSAIPVVRAIPEETAPIATEPTQAPERTPENR